MVELCKSRINILSLDEETLLREAKNINLEKIRTAIKQVYNACECEVSSKAWLHTINVHNHCKFFCDYEKHLIK